MTSYGSLDDEIELSDDSENEVVTKTLIRLLIRNPEQAKTIVYSSSQVEWFEDSCITGLNLKKLTTLRKFHWMNL